MSVVSIKIDTKNFDEVIRTLQKTTDGHTYEVKVGILEGAKNDEGEIIAEYAAINEFGGPGVPSRPFMRSTVKEKSAEWGDLFRGYLKNRLGKDQRCVFDALHLVGRIASLDMKAKIMSNMPPPNNPVYAASKKKINGGYSGTLFNTGAMHKSIDYSIMEDGKLMK